MWSYWLEHHTNRPVCLGIKGGVISGVDVIHSFMNIGTNFRK